MVAQGSLQNNETCEQRLQPEMVVRSSLNAIPEDTSNNEGTNSYDVVS